MVKVQVVYSTCRWRGWTISSTPNMLRVLRCCSESCVESWVSSASCYVVCEALFLYALQLLLLCDVDRWPFRGGVHHPGKYEESVECFKIVRFCPEGPQPPWHVKPVGCSLDDAGDMIATVVNQLYFHVVWWCGLPGEDYPQTEAWGRGRSTVEVWTYITTVLV